MFLSPQQNDVRRIGMDPLPRVLLLVLPNLVRVVQVGPLDVEHCHNEDERNYGLGMDALLSVRSWNTNGIIMMGMDALVSVCSPNPNGMMVWAWMLWIAYARRTRTELWFGHGCSA